MKLHFSDDFFQAETRDGFFIEEMMKRAWAAQMVVLSEFDKVCKKHGLKWFADFGTLLGAVRHKGYIPWDDDIDISMVRSDYEIFINKAYKDLPEGYYIMTFHNVPDYDDYMARVVNHPSIDYTPAVMEKYYGFPYACGLDITYLDYIPQDPQEYSVYADLIDVVGSAAINYEDESIPYEDRKNLVKQIEKLLKVKIDRGGNIPNQLRILCDRICGMYTEKDSNRLGMAIKQNIEWCKYTFDADALLDIKELPFEGSTIQVPGNYEEVIIKRFGENYMTPVRTLNHNYPFYKSQMEYEEMMNG